MSCRVRTDLEPGGVSKGLTAARWVTYKPWLTRLAGLAECDLGADRYFLISGELNVPRVSGGSDRSGGVICASSRGFGRVAGL